ncbi:MAG: hypothetical protein ABI216_18440 [Devosia sp.]
MSRFSSSVAELHTLPRRDFIGRVRQIVTEYMGEGLGPTAAMAEIRAALRELDRRAFDIGEKR